jgi:hypothetical protein
MAKNLYPQLDKNLNTIDYPFIDKHTFLDPKTNESFDSIKLQDNTYEILPPPPYDTLQPLNVKCIKQKTHIISKRKTQIKVGKRLRYVGFNPRISNEHGVYNNKKRPKRSLHNIPQKHRISESSKPQQINHNTTSGDRQLVSLAIGGFGLTLSCLFLIKILSL